jgi:tRNA uridine 5-carboxymethylaminomethyl modification enzyme
MSDRYDVIVIGGGHAGAEAAMLAARRGARTMLLTQHLETIGQMSCNPAIGGIAKGTIVREIDALGGIMGRATDLARIQFRMLNRSKGPAVWSPRAQCDRGLYRRAVRTLLEANPRIDFRQGTAAALKMAGECIDGVVTLDGEEYCARAVVLTAGTFLRGRIHQGLAHQTPAGRAGEAPAVEIAEALEAAGLTVMRFKTGTPPRIDGRSVDLGQLERQDGDKESYWFSHFVRSRHPEQRPCYLTYSGSQLREIVQRNLKQSALYGGVIASRGPRYCPSIEDKIVKFPGAARHQVFLEPEGLETTEMYVNGLSTSLPASVQLEFLLTLPGLENVRMTRPGYAIEYDFFPPTQLTSTLESKAIPGLFFAGQVNGTTGYEEAAAQGVVAGLNAAAKALELDPVWIARSDGFIGVLVDDLVSRGVDEPYRLFTSRSEYRLLLRQDNALRRLRPLASQLHLLSQEECRCAESRLAAEDRVRDLVESTSVSPENVNAILESLGSASIREPARIADLARRPEVPLAELLNAIGVHVDAEPIAWANIELKYSGYMAKERAAADRVGRMEDFEIPSWLEYRAISSLSSEAREKLSAVQPTSLGQASRIPGVSPSDIQNLVVAVLRLRAVLPAVSRETGLEA